jgi:hypothetical protein
MTALARVALGAALIQTDTGSPQYRDFTFDKVTPKPPSPATSR